MLSVLHDARGAKYNHVVRDPRDRRVTHSNRTYRGAARVSCGPGRGADEASVLSDATVLRNRSIKLSVVV